MSEYIFKLPDLGEGTVESEIAEWFIKVGDLVEEEAVVGTMMTDKAAVEVSSPVTGTVVKLAGEPGDIVAVGAPLVVFATDAPASERKAAADSVGATPGRDSTAPDSDRPHEELLQEEQKTRGATATTRVKASPAIRRRAKEAGINLDDVPASGAGGRITRADFDEYLEMHSGAVHGLDSTAPASRPARRLTDAVSKTREIKVIGLRRIIAERMAEAVREIPHFTYVEEIDVTELEALRQHLNDSHRGARLTLLPFLGMALIRALREFPQCNATYDKTRNVIVQHGPVHLGIATQTNDGLKVPVVRDAQRLLLDELGSEIQRVSGAARDNSIGRDELTGSTITITSLGKLGGIMSTPVINQPEVGIIGVNRAVERPVVLNGQVVIRTMMNLSSSFDHRFVDGYDAAAMIQRIREMLEHPATTFMPQG